MMHREDHAVTLTGITKEYARPTGEVLKAVEGIDLQICAGEFVVILGPSGCGKTTLLKLIQGIESPTRGDVEKAPGSTSAYVFQTPSLFPWLTVHRNVEFGLRLASSGNVDKQQRVTRVSDLLELTGLAEFADYYPQQISGGMQQRVNLCRALALKPSVLLMDEPFSALDAMTKERLQVELSSIAHQLDMTTIFITHDIREAVFLADRVIVMNSSPGRIREQLVISEPHPRTVEYQHSQALGQNARVAWKALSA